jgi:heme/copper-type cytochrome/quinol oxidase subunit 2
MRWLGLLMMVFIFSGCYSGYESPENKKYLDAKERNQYNKWYNENEMKQQDKENKKYEKPNTSFHEDL